MAKCRSIIIIFSTQRPTRYWIGIYGILAHLKFIHNLLIILQVVFVLSPPLRLKWGTKKVKWMTWWIMKSHLHGIITIINNRRLSQSIIIQYFTLWESQRLLSLWPAPKLLQLEGMRFTCLLTQWLIAPLNKESVKMEIFAVVWPDLNILCTKDVTRVKVDDERR